MKNLYTLYTILLFSGNVFSQSYSNWITGDSLDVEVVLNEQKLFLAGGGTDNDQAMAKMLTYAQGGDVLVIRASGSDGYNPYFFGELGVNVNSVETIKWNSAEASNDPYVQRRMREAELVFIAGGDQSVYRDYWTHPEIKEIFEYLILEKKVTMGGTSAGAVILCDYPYTPINDGATSAELLSNPYHDNAESLFLDAPIEHPFASNLIVDTHFDQRNRLGRLCVFLQRAYIHTGFSKNLTAIGLNEVTAIEVDENQDAIVFGEFPNYQDYVYIIKANCDTEQAELFTENQTVEWSYGNEAIAMKRKPGKINPTGYINLTNSEGEPDIADFFLGINNGVVAQIPAQIECVFLAASTSQAQESDIKLYNDNMQLRIELPENNYAESLEIFNITGQRIFYGEDQNLIDISSYATGKYQLIIRTRGKTFNHSFSKL